MPMMPVIGVRISWLMFARNSLLSLAERTAASRARASSADASRWSVTSEQVPAYPANVPSAVRRGAAVS
jgi:hypothetical protein